MDIMIPYSIEEVKKITSEHDRFKMALESIMTHIRHDNLHWSSDPAYHIARQALGEK